MKLIETENRRIFIISDPHFGHENIIKYEDRPFSSVEEMNNTLIRNWNHSVIHSDTIIVLGDFAYGIRTKEAIEIFEQLKGRFIFVFGNHDSRKFISYMKNSKRVMHAGSFIDTKIQLLGMETFRASLMHYPIEHWPAKEHGAIHFHGHMHGDGRIIKNRIDTCVDATRIYGPRLMSKTIEYMRRRDEKMDTEELGRHQQ